MKNNIRKIIFIFTVIFVVAVSFACREKPEKEPFPNDSLEESENGGKDNDDKKIITSSDKVDVSDLTLLDSMKVDFNKDGFEETIGLYTVAERMPDGEIAWDDGQRWLLSVQGENKDYILFDDYVQLGSIGFFAYFQDEDFVISTIHSGTANLTLTEYKFEEDMDGFVEATRFMTEGNVNMYHQIPLIY